MGSFPGCVMSFPRETKYFQLQGGDNKPPSFSMVTVKTNLEISQKQSVSTATVATWIHRKDLQTDPEQRKTSVMEACKPFWDLGDISVKHPPPLLKRQKSYTAACFLPDLQVLEGHPRCCPHWSLHSDTRLPATASSYVGCTNRSLKALKIGGLWGLLVLCWGLHLAMTHAMSSRNRSSPAALKQAKYK